LLTQAAMESPHLEAQGIGGFPNLTMSASGT